MAVELLVDDGVEDLTDDRILVLIDDPDDYAIWLTSGVFIEAQGFVIDEEGRVARPDPSYGENRREGEPLIVELAWRAE